MVLPSPKIYVIGKQLATSYALSAPDSPSQFIPILSLQLAYHNHSLLLLWLVSPSEFVGGTFGKYSDEDVSVQPQDDISGFMKRQPEDISFVLHHHVTSSCCVMMKTFTSGQAHTSAMFLPSTALEL